MPVSFSASVPTYRGWVLLTGPNNPLAEEVIEVSGEFRDSRIIVNNLWDLG